MQFIDADTIDRPIEIDTDICIVGSGAAGITLASELDNTPYRVCLLEGGGLELEEETERALFAIETVGHPISSDLPFRRRYFGGSTNAWFGRIAIFDPIDFAARAWVPHSGWPIAYDTVAAYYERAADILKVPHFDKIRIDQWRDDPTYRAFADTKLSAGMFLWADWMDMGPRYIDKLRRSRNVSVYFHANVTEIEASEDSTVVERLQVRSLNNNQFTVTARVYILACGGLENPRLLLVSQKRSAAGLGNRHDLVGRYYMDHPRGEGIGAVYLDDQSAETMARVARLGQQSRTQYGQVQMHLTFGEQLQREEQLLNHCMHFHIVREGQGTPGYQALRALSQQIRDRHFSAELLRHMRDAIADSPRLLNSARNIARGKRIECLVAIDQLEQAPDSNSRITLSHEKDRFGKPFLKLDWRIGAATRESWMRLQRLVAERLKAQRIGRLESPILEDPAYEPQFIDMRHPSGTTRMSDDPRSGVVDADCRVHGVDNLYIAGSSVFPTVGHANPTLTIVALAIRLADHIKQALGAATSGR